MAGFATPEDEWFRQDSFKKFVYELLDSELFLSRNIVDTSKAKALYDRHLTGEINISKDIWKWMHLELWFRKFID
ncbi:MAG: asparagine synthase-related protein [Bacteroidota bacterium]